MKSNKSKKVFIISIIVLALILVAGLVYAIVATDLFKSDKALFFKYASQLFDEENKFLDNRIEQYNQKKESNLFENKGIIAVEGNNRKKYLDVSFEGNIDTANDSMEELIKLNYSDDVNLPVIYKKVKNTQGIKISELSKRFFTISESNNSENNTISKQIESFDNISKYTDFSKFELTAEEKEKLKNVYIKTIEDKLENSNFTKVATLESNGYSLSISYEKFKEIVLGVMDVLKDDDAMLKKLGNIVNMDITSENINSVIENIKESEFGQGTIIITVYQNQNKLNKIEIQLGDMYKFSIASSSNDNSANLKISLGSTDFAIDADITYEGLKNLEQVQENYLVDISGENSFQISIGNKVDFSNEDKISNFNSNETINLAELSEEKFNKLMTSIGNGIDKLNKEKIEKAGIKEDESFISNLMNLAQFIQHLSLNSEIKVTNPTKNEEENITETNINKDEDKEEKEDKKEEKNSSSVVNSMEKASKEAFNEKFQQYEGDEVKGTTVKSLIMQIIANNMVDDVKQVEVTGDVNLTGDEVPDTITASKYYKVKCSTDKDGYVNKVEIKEKK